MSGSVNKVILVGNLAEIRTTQNGKEMASFSIATSESWTDKISGIRSERTEWHNIVVFSDGLVKIVKDYVRKGNKVYIEGCLRTRKWVDQNNNDRYTTEIVLQNFNSTLTLLTSKITTTVDDNNTEHSNSNYNGEYKKDATNDQVTDEIDFIDDEVPF